MNELPFTVVQRVIAGLDLADQLKLLLSSRRLKGFLDEGVITNIRSRPRICQSSLQRSLYTGPRTWMEMTSILIGDASPIVFTSCKCRSRPHPSVWWRDEPGIRSLSMRSGSPDIASPRETRPTTVFLHREGRRERNTERTPWWTLPSNWPKMMPIFWVWSNRHGYSTSTWIDSH